MTAKADAVSTKFGPITNIFGEPTKGQVLLDQVQRKRNMTD